MADSLREELRQFLLPNVRLTGRRLGAGAYGSVEEVAIPGLYVRLKNTRSILGPYPDPGGRYSKGYSTIRYRVSFYEHHAPSSYCAIFVSVLLGRPEATYSRDGASPHKFTRFAGVRWNAAKQNQIVLSACTQVLHPLRRGQRSGLPPRPHPARISS